MIQLGCNEAILTNLIKNIIKKKSKSPSDSSNYRVISLNCIVSKILDNVKIALIKGRLKTNIMQCAYKCSFTTSLCSFLVLEIIQYYRGRGSNVYASMLDDTKTFDKVKCSKLFDILIGRENSPLIIHFFLDMYLLSSAAVN